MKHKLSISILIFLFSILAINAQSNYYYYYKGQKIYLELDKSTINLITNNNFTYSETSNIGLNPYTLQQDSELVTNKFGKVEFQSEPTLIDFYEKINLLKSKTNIKSIGFFFKRNGTTSIGTSNYFYVKLKSENDFNTLQQYTTQNNVQIVKQVPNMNLWYILSVTNTQFSSLELSNQFYESGLFADVDPAFMFNFKNHYSDDTKTLTQFDESKLFSDINSVCANDTNFDSLWGLNNTPFPNFDINACQAWNISQGLNVKVAVIDSGIHTTHNDLSGNISPFSFNTITGTSPSQPALTGEVWHGTHVAGIVGAIKDNNLQVVGVAPQCKIMPISSSLQTFPTLSAELASGISWAYQNGADIINNSWGDQGGHVQLNSVLLENSIIDALTLGRNNKGTLVVFAAGNYGSWPVYGVDYPASFNENITTVGAINIYGQRTPSSAFGDKLDLMAPGVHILSTMPNNQTQTQSGTSMASPHVAGVCALILSVNPCLTGQQVRNIIEQTAQKISPNPPAYSYTPTLGRPNGSWNYEMGYGLVDAYAAVLMAQSMGSPDLDLMVKDSQDDTGAEPNTVTQYMWTSDNIWVRNNNDSGLAHENPDYSANGNPNYVKVRVINKSCVQSTGNEQLKLYWAKASTGLSWPTPWNGGISEPVTNASMGQQIGTLTIPVLQAGQETILTFPWQVPNPTDYSQDQWHFCLLARIEATNDPMTSIETVDINANTRNNNNIAWKNVTVVDILPNNIVNPGGVVAVANPFNHPKTFFLELEIADLETGKPIYQEAEVGIKMDEILFNAWERGGKEAQLLDPTLEEKRKIVRGNHVILDNISFNANETGTLRLDFNFLIEELTEKTNYAYHVIQKDGETGQVIGGETFIIIKNPRPIFEAEAPDKEVDLNQAITISAKDINEPAIYNWYDNEGNLIYQGKDLQIANAISEKFKLEVISTVDGFKDYTEVEVKLKPSTLENIMPNPATNNVLVSYKLNGVNSAYLMVIGYYGSNGTSNNYILNVNSNETNLNVSDYPSGFYTVALVVNGEIVDAKTLIKQ